MPERGGVEVAQLGERERGGREREADVRVGELAAQALARGEHDLGVVERQRRQVVDDVPGGVGGQLRIDVGGDEAEKGGGELAVGSGAGRARSSPELLEMGDLADVDLRCELAADRAVERLVGRERPAGQGPGAAERLARPLPEQRLQHPVAHLQHCREHDLRGGCGRILERFLPHSLKP